MAALFESRRLAQQRRAQRSHRRGKRVVLSAAVSLLTLVMACGALVRYLLDTDPIPFADSCTLSGCAVPAHCGEYVKMRRRSAAATPRRIISRAATAQATCESVPDQHGRGRQDVQVRADTRLADARGIPATVPAQGARRLALGRHHAAGRPGRPLLHRLASERWQAMDSAGARGVYCGRPLARHLRRKRR